MVYLDYASAHPPTETARRALEESFQWFGNPGSPHRLGREAKMRLEQCRDGLRELLEAKRTYDVVFTASATESNNMAILGQSYGEDDEILYGQAAHPSLLEPLQKVSAAKIPIPLERGRITIDGLTSVLSPKSRLLLLDHVNGQSGLICDIEACAQLAGPDVHVHVDASQSFTKLPLSLRSEAIDSLTLSGHKIGAPRGSAALLVKRYGVGPILWGGGQERGLRSGTENLPSLWAFYQCAREGGDLAHLRALKTQLVQGIEAMGGSFPFEREWTADHICAFLHPHEEASSVLGRLDERDIFLSQASACSTAVAKREEALSRQGLSREEGRRFLRASLGFPSTSREIEQFLQTLREPFPLT